MAVELFSSTLTVLSCSPSPSAVPSLTVLSCSPSPSAVPSSSFVPSPSGSSLSAASSSFSSVLDSPPTLKPAVSAGAAAAAEAGAAAAAEAGAAEPPKAETLAAANKVKNRNFICLNKISLK
eukprot:CAMPEP_0175099720 /NCGR_PEP_ID=MMETSP0086_2-20121207/6624_1 /TAXON_ID=136419 /ORGANISM="Unknown Unknown, Strain D1" /LENGTH=121 /DNA_ID=CAMNT_0016373623 /DNA_START=245 /DNA_END=607 /DNA_ORIENTATION=-